jgi:hypothetical protein
MSTKKEELQGLQEELAEAKSELRKFKKANKIRNAEEIEDAKIQEEFDVLQETVDELQTQVDQTREEAKSEKGTSAGGGAKYGYPQITDPATQEKRDLTKEEKKRWRTHARKAASKAGIGPEEVPFDENFFLPKVKVEKVKAENPKKDAEAGEKATDAAPKGKGKNRKNKSAPETDLEDMD